MSITYYSIEAGDQVYRILRDHYGDGLFFESGEELIAKVRKNNPHISNLDLIYPGQTIALAGVPGAATKSAEIAPQLAHGVPDVARELEQSPSWVRETFAKITAERIATKVGGSYVKYVKSESLKAMQSFENVTKNYDHKVLSQVTRGAYDGRRIKYMSQYDQSLGALKPLHRPLKASRAVLHVDPHSPVPASTLLAETKTLNRYFKLASKGIVILRVASVADVASKVYSANSASQQVEEVAKAGGGVAGGLVGGFVGSVACAALIASPVGWVAIGGILLAGSAGVLGGLAGEEIADRMSDGLLYDENGKAIYKDKLFSGGFSLP